MQHANKTRKVSGSFELFLATSCPFRVLSPGVEASTNRRVDGVTLDGWARFPAFFHVAAFLLESKHPIWHLAARQAHDVGDGPQSRHVSFGEKGDRQTGLASATRAADAVDVRH